MTKHNINLKALSVIQPWAHTIIFKGKNIENRDWDTSWRGYFAIHASKRKDVTRFDVCSENYGININPNQVAYGAILGFVELTEIVNHETLTKKTEKWFEGSYGFVLKNVIPIKKPITVKGALGFWFLKGKALEQVLSQLTTNQRKMVLENPLSKKPR